MEMIWQNNRSHNFEWPLFFGLSQGITKQLDVIWVLKEGLTLIGDTSDKNNATWNPSTAVLRHN
jgi:hypothetical protein